MRTPSDADLPTLGYLVSANVKRARQLRGLNVRDLAARLEDLGYRLLPSAITKIEARASTKPLPPGKTSREYRSVDVDDLAALALALETSPAFLLAPPDGEPVAITKKVQSSGDWTVEWIRGAAPLDRDTSDDMFLALAPERLQRRAAAARELIRRELSTLEALVTNAVLADQTGDSAPDSRALRAQMDRVVRHVELLVERLEAEEGARDA